jgi:hypothetical protein
MLDIIARARLRQAVDSPSSVSIPDTLLQRATASVTPPPHTEPNGRTRRSACPVD